MATQYTLSTSLVGHTADVKAVAAAGANGIISASRDATVRLWQKKDGSVKNYDLVATISAHSSFVNSVAWVSPNQQYPNGLVISGGQDNIIYAHSPTDTANPVLTLVGHTGNVCALSVLQTDNQLILLSGSWDKTARVWDLGSGACLETLEGHEQAVWAVAAFENGQWLTGSADKTIKLWSGGKAEHTYTGHTDCVRSITLIPGIGFVSTSNDSTLKVWTLDGTPVQELIGHTAYVYSCAYSPFSGEIISGGEDRSLRVWLDGTNVQTILHPADSVWSVATLPNGDVVSGTNDGVVRVFTRNPERAGDADHVVQFDEHVKSHSIAAEAIDPKHISGPETVAQPGKKDGEVKMVRNATSNVVEAFQWSAAQGQWIKVGEVTNVRKDAKKVFEGVEYDYVFDVEIGDGGPMRQLPYNSDENPYTAAQRFIHREELSQGFLDQVAKFITQNTGGATISQAAPAAVDPYTGASRYSGGAPMSGSHASQAAFDPYTGASRYSGGAPMPGTAVGANPSPSTDPFAFSGAYTTSSVQSSASSSSTSSVSASAFVYLDAGNLNAVHQKIQQLNGELAQSEATQKVAFTAADLQALAALVDVVSAQTKFHATTVTEAHLNVLLKGTRWPADKRFPVLDLFRLTVLHPSTIEFFASSKQREQQLLDVIFEASQLVDGVAGSEINQMFGFRILVNSFKSKLGRDFIVNKFNQIAEVLESFPTASNNKNLHQSLSTLLLNLSILSNDTLSEKKALIVTIVLQELSNSNIDDDVASRLLTAITNLAKGQNENVIKLAKQQGLDVLLKQYGLRSNDKLKALIAQLTSAH